MILKKLKKKKDSRKRRRCFICHKRVNLIYKVKWGKIYLECPNCKHKAELYLKHGKLNCK